MKANSSLCISTIQPCSFAPLNPHHLSSPWDKFYVNSRNHLLHRAKTARYDSTASPAVSVLSPRYQTPIPHEQPSHPKPSIPSDTYAPASPQPYTPSKPHSTTLATKCQRQTGTSRHAPATPSGAHASSTPRNRPTWPATPTRGKLRRRPRFGFRATSSLGRFTRWDGGGMCWG